MGEGKSDVEHWIAPVNNLVVQKHQTPSVNENVLRAVVAVNQAFAHGASLSDQPSEERCRGGQVFGGMRVERFQAKCLEEPAVARHRFKAPRSQAGTPVDASQQLTELPDMIGVDQPFEEHRFPVCVRLRHCLHGEQVIRLLFKHEDRNGTWWSEGGESSHAESFPVDSFRAAEPGHRDPKLSEGLFEEPGLPAWSRDQHRPIRHPTSQNADVRRFRGADLPGALEPFDERDGLFNVELDHGERVPASPLAGLRCKQKHFRRRRIGKGLASVTISRFLSQNTGTSPS